MKRRIISLILLVCMLLPVSFLTACNKKEEDADSISEDRTYVSIDLWLPCYEGTTEESKQRLRVLVKTSDGFAVAEEDLRLRGPGDFFGSRQHGLPEMHIADLFGNMDMVKEAQEAAREIIQADPALADPELRPLRQHIRELFALNENTWN